MQRSIIEMFSSIQGEGKYVGCRQVFVRFAGCNLACRYCDTENAPAKHPVCQVETHAGSRAFREEKNPLSLAQAAEEINGLLREVPHQAVSFTGGEPLLQADFIHALRPLVAAPFFLETNGTCTQQLAAIIGDIDIISMDIKLPSALPRPVWEAHRSFLRIARAKDLYLKMVLSAETREEEFLEGVRLIREEAPDALLILQPVTPFGGCEAIAPARVLALQAAAAQQLRDVRVIPQTHRMMQQL
ncbi:7-carboxy-7-deazaguanine synthase QueE [Selenomonas bovis]|uniref:7-carboxy-7-deazaguanine synthase n=1 Tax=Selenomonas bovis TaxID=416586 RepID=A0A848B7I6_9FIRM|nr:7-carboxy-7-deazaguanine synthase QueE [Selenomonas bovis]NMD98462.1 7-carboxy-7-deazaguanine synthase QueE [Selenomonas bovis]